MGAVQRTSQFSAWDLPLYSIFASLQNKDVNGNKQLPRVYVLPLYYVRGASGVAGRAPKGCSRQLRKRMLTTAMKTRTECRRIQWHTGTPLPLHELQYECSENQGQAEKKPQNIQAELLQREVSIKPIFLCYCARLIRTYSMAVTFS